MEHRRKVATWTGAILGTLCALLFAAQAQAWPGKLTEEFHHTYPLSANGRIELENINGAVHITAWDQNEVKVDAVKYANTQDRLDDAKIEVEASNDSISIRTEYRDHDHTFSGSWHDPAGVEYTLMVPRNARLDEIKLINGSLDIHQVAGEVQASCINGRLEAQGLQGRVKLETINGRLEPQFDRLGSSRIELSSVNGGIELTLPSDAKAEIEASTVSGGINNDFGLHVINHHWVGHEMRGELGGGGSHIEVSNVNGHIEIRHANDGKTVSPVKDLSREDKDDDDEI